MTDLEVEQEKLRQREKIERIDILQKENDQIRLELDKAQLKLNELNNEYLLNSQVY